MIYIVHGDDTSKSRALVLNHQKKLGLESKITLELKNTNTVELLEKCSSTSLFGETPMVVLDISDAGKANMETYFDTIKKIPASTTLVIFSSKPLTKSNIFISKAIEIDAKILENNVFTDANIFKFTDVLFSKNRAATYTELSKLLVEDFDPFYIFTMILFGLRSMAKVLWNAPSVAKMKPFQVSKNMNTLNRFSEQKIKQLYFYLYDIEKRAKTGEVTPEMMLTFAIEKVIN